MEPPETDEEKWIEIARLAKSITDLAASSHEDVGSENDPTRSHIFKEAEWIDPQTDETIVLRQWTAWTNAANDLPRIRYSVMGYRGLGPTVSRDPDFSYRFVERNGTLEIRDEATYVDIDQYSKKMNESRGRYFDHLYRCLAAGREALHITVRWSKQLHRDIDYNAEFEKMVVHHAVENQTEAINELKAADQSMYMTLVYQVMGEILNPLLTGDNEAKRTHSSKWRLSRHAVIAAIIEEAAHHGNAA